MAFDSADWELLSVRSELLEGFRSGRVCGVMLQEEGSVRLDMLLGEADATEAMYAKLVAFCTTTMQNYRD